MPQLKENNVLVDVRDLAVYFHIEQGIVKAVDGVNFKIEKGKSLGVVGESGCGKTVTALSLLLLHPQPEGQIEKGNIFFYPDGENRIDIAKLGIHSKQIRKTRGNDIAMIFQEPMMSLNPVHSIGQQIMESIRLHQKVNKRRAKEIGTMPWPSAIPARFHQVDLERQYGEVAKLEGGAKRHFSQVFACFSSLVSGLDFSDNGFATIK